MRERVGDTRGAGLQRETRGLCGGIEPATPGGMHTPPAPTLFDLPLSDFQTRAARARAVLRDARTRVGRVGGLRAVDAALDEVEALLPGLMDRPRPPLARRVRDLLPHERGMVREAVETDGPARKLLPRVLGEASLAEVRDALARVEEQESVAFELMALLRTFERAYCAPLLACS